MCVCVCETTVLQLPHFLSFSPSPMIFQAGLACQQQGGDCKGTAQDSARPERGILRTSDKTGFRVLGFRV